MLRIKEIFFKKISKNFLTLIFIILLSSLVCIIFFFYQYPKFKVGVIEIEGAITKDSDLDINKVISCIKRFNSSNDIKIILIKIDSPGGDLNEVYKIIRVLNKVNKTKIAYIDSFGTSGAYLIASQTDYIISEPYSIIGSIGVVLSYFEIHKLLEKLGIEYKAYYKGKYKDILSPFRNATEEEERLIMNFIEKVYKDIVDLVKKKRNVSEYVFTSAIFLGKEGIKYGLVDEVGGFDDVKEYISKKYNVSKDEIFFEYCNTKKKKGIIEQLLGIYLEKIIVNSIKNLRFSYFLS